MENDPTRPNGLDSLNAGTDLYKERCLRIKAENDLKEALEKHSADIAKLELDLYMAKRNWWRKFKLPKLVWRGECDE